MSTSLLYAGLVISIAFSASEQWLSYRMMPQLTRIAMVLPSITLIVIFIVFAIFEADLPANFQQDADLIALIIYFVWKAIGLIIARREYHVLG